MKRTHPLKISWPFAALILTIHSFAQTTHPHPQPAAYHQKLQSASLLFMENKGQVADAKGNLRPDILFTANCSGTKLYLSANAIYYQFTKTEYPKGYELHTRVPAQDLPKEAGLQKQIKQITHQFSLELQGANPHPVISTEKQSEYTENYYLAQCPNGITGVHGYEKIIYKNVYPNIDWVIYSKGGFMEYDFLVHPGGNPSSIKLKVKDAESVSLTATGDLLMKTSLGEVREKTPVSYADGVAIETHFRQLGDGSIGFDVQPQPGKELRIDPSVIWATYYGGNADDRGNNCCVDSNGDVFMVGSTKSSSGIAAGGFQNTFGGGENDAFLVKLNKNGNRLWSTYYGGVGDDQAYSCCIDKDGNIYMAGHTASVTGIAFGGFQNTYGGGEYDAFLVKLNNNGNRLWATYYGSNNYEEAFFTCADNLGNIYLTGPTNSPDNIASGGFQNIYGGSTNDGFLVKFSNNGTRLWATYYGGSLDDQPYSCTVDRNNNVFLAGITFSTSGISSNGFQNTYGGGQYDAFLIKFNTSGNRIWGTYYGGNNFDYGFSCSTDSFNNVYLSGTTTSTSGIAFGGYDNTYSGGSPNGGDAFLVKFDNNGSRIWATYYGGSGDDFGYSSITDPIGNVYMAGNTTSASIASGGIQNTYSGNTDGFLVKFNSAGNSVWATYYGGIGIDKIFFIHADSSGYVYTPGYTSSTAGIASNGFQNTYGGGSYDAFLVKIDGNKSITIVCPNGSQTLTSNLIGPSYQWQINTGGGFTNLSNSVNYSGTNTRNLQINSLSSAWYGYQYRCLVNSNYAEPYEIRFSTTWIGTTNSAWENPANWSCGILPDGNTDVIINTGPVTLNSNGICRTLTVRPGVSFTVASGYTLTITH